MCIRDKKFYLTKDGLEKFKAEFRELKELRTQKVREAENEEEIEFIDVRLKGIEGILRSYELISLPPKEKRDVIDLGARVLAEVNGRETEFTIVGSLESNPMFGYISHESPVGKALLGRRAGEAVQVKASLPIEYRIKRVVYNSGVIKSA